MYKYSVKDKLRDKCMRLYHHNKRVEDNCSWRIILPGTPKHTHTSLQGQETQPDQA